MSISEEYQKQNSWRNWESYLSEIPINKSDTVFDLGCSLGFVTNLFSERVKDVHGIDINPEFIKKAQKLNTKENINFHVSNLNSISHLSLPFADGIWSSFVAAYFPDLKPVLKNWLDQLKPNGWIALVEINDLFGHSPINKNTKNQIRAFYQHQSSKNFYDFEMGHKLKIFMEDCGLVIEKEFKIPDPEFTFQGPASNEILNAWKSRLNRMKGPWEFFGDKVFTEIKKELLKSLTSKSHKSTTTVNFVIARKPN